MSIIFIFIYLYKFYSFKKRIDVGNKVTDFNQVFFISNGDADKKLEGYLITKNIKDINLFYFCLCIDIIVLFLYFIK